MTKEIFLHAGMHKTGTTAIQSYLSKNRRNLARKGFATMNDLALARTWWSGSFARSTNCFRIAHLAIDAARDTPMRLKGVVKAMTSNEKEAAIAELKRTIDKCKAPRIIVSSEAFSFLRSDEEHELLQRIFGDCHVRPILFFRDKSKWLQSWTAELAKHLDAACSERAAAVACRLSDEHALLDHEAIQRFWGHEGIYLSYDDAVRDNGSVIPAFLSALGLDPEESPPWKAIWRNQSSRADMAPHPVAATVS